ncbi:hypothetical protein AZE42_09488 [Rhizopogon vesiculosus]|uniref:Uncharacterized protein n=1 Tax=Rhizopogon vesiculosus TaxID=180088 RepID=A0A1J8Q3D0_9AGAM|nr:hypothetical protein AZE42_09488 [Rhizopogon vesiculosus]
MISYSISTAPGIRPFSKMRILKGSYSSIYRELEKNVLTRLKLKKTISLATAQRWMKHAGH